MSHDALIRAGRKAPLFRPGASTRELSLDQAAIERLVPHRAPFLLVDAIDQVDLEERCIRGRRRIDPADPVFTGHFPGDPVYPGVLLLETMAQACICLQQLLAAGGGELAAGVSPPKLRLLRIHHAIFLAEVRPGDQLTVVGKLLEETAYTSMLAAQILKDDTICAFGILEAYLLDQQGEGA